MKKLVLMFVAVAAISFASCVENKPAAPAEAEPIDTVTTVDTTAVDTAAATVDTAAVAE